MTPSSNGTSKPRLERFQEFLDRWYIPLVITLCGVNAIICIFQIALIVLRVATMGAQ